MNEIVKIDKGVPLPTARRKYPWDEMEVGDSFFSPVGQATLMTQSRRRSDRKFTSCAVEENGVRGTRIWRVK